MSSATECVEPATDHSRGLSRRQLEAVEKIREAGRIEASFILSLVEGLEPRTTRRRRLVAGEPLSTAPAQVVPEPAVPAPVIGSQVPQAERPTFIATPVQTAPHEVVAPPVAMEFAPPPPAAVASVSATLSHETSMSAFSTSFSAAPQVAWAGGPMPDSPSNPDRPVEWWVSAGANSAATPGAGRSAAPASWLQQLRSSTFLHDTLVGQVVVPMFVLVVVLGLLLAFLG